MRWVRGLIGLVGELLITAGVLILLFLVWQLWWTDIPAGREQSAQVQALERDFAKPDRATGDPAPALTGEAYAIIRIPRFGADFAKPILQGTDHDTLTKGVGHYAETAEPGQVGNFAIAGHRTTYGKPFNQIAELKVGDKIDIQTKVGRFVYVVKETEIVAPTEVGVIAPVPDKPDAKPTQKWLTMTSCHPMFSAATRYIVHAQLESAS